MTTDKTDELPSVDPPTTTEYPPEVTDDDIVTEGDIPAQELVNELHAAVTVMGYVPTAKEMQELGDYSAATYARRFGGWLNALDVAGIEAPENRQKKAAGTMDRDGQQ